MIFWITGNSGAGKTTLAHNLARANDIILDGDALREIWPELGFSREDRWTHNLRVSRLARMLEGQRAYLGANIFVAVISPYRELRAEVKEICGCQFIYVPGGREPSEEFPYEPPEGV